MGQNPGSSGPHWDFHAMKPEDKVRDDTKALQTREVAMISWRSSEGKGWKPVIFTEQTMTSFLLARKDFIGEGC